MVDTSRALEGAASDEPEAAIPGASASASQTSASTSSATGTGGGAQAGELWRETHGHRNVYTLHDPTAELLSLWPGGSTSLSMFVDRDRVIVSKLQYVSNEATIEAAIDELFSP